MDVTRRPFAWGLTALAGLCALVVFLVWAVRERDAPAPAVLMGPRVSDEPYEERGVLLQGRSVPKASADIVSPAEAQRLVGEHVRRDELAAEVLKDGETGAKASVAQGVSQEAETTRALLQKLWDLSPAQWEQAEGILSRLAALGEGAVPELVQALSDPRTGCYAALALARMDPKVTSCIVPDLLRVMRGTSVPRTRSHVIALVRLAPDDPVVGTEILSAASGRDKVGKEALQALPATSVEAARALPLFAEELRIGLEPGAGWSGSHGRLAFCLRGIAGYGPAMAPLSDPLVLVFRRFHAAEAGAALGAVATDPCLCELEDALHFERSTQVQEAGLSGFHSAPRQAQARLAPLVVPLLESFHWYVRVNAVLALEESGFTGAGAVSGLISHLNDENASVRSRAARALGTLGVGSREVLDALEHATRDPDDRFAADARAVLEGLRGTDATESGGADRSDTTEAGGPGD